MNIGNTIMTTIILVRNFILTRFVVVVVVMIVVDGVVVGVVADPVMATATFS
jgi:hypothetical protein